MLARTAAAPELLSRLETGRMMFAFIHLSAVGRYEDELVRRNGEWLIAKRRRSE